MLDKYQRRENYMIEIENKYNEKIKDIDWNDFNYKKAEEAYNNELNKYKNEKYD